MFCHALESLRLMMIVMIMTTLMIIMVAVMKMPHSNWSEGFKSDISYSTDNHIDAACT